MFIEELKRRQFASARFIVTVLDDGNPLTVDYLEGNGFHSPIVVRHADGLDIRVPKLTLSDIERSIGADRVIDVIDVQKQDTVEMTLGHFVDTFRFVRLPGVALRAHLNVLV